LIKIYYCPTRRAPTGYGSVPFGRIDYAGCAGYFQGEMHEGFGDIPAPPLGKTPRRNERTHENWGDWPGAKGVVVWPGRRATPTAARLPDGSPNPTAVAEKTTPPPRRGTEGGDNERWNNTGWDEAPIRWHFPPLSDTDPKVIVTTSTGDTVWRRYFGSAHS